MRAADYRYFDGPFAALAHRGGALLPANIGRENTLHAFSQAVALGFSHVETDVHATSDGVALAFHDPRLDRVTDMTGAIADMPWSEVSQARVGGVDAIPTLDELFEVLPDTCFNIDIKAEGAIAPLADVIRRHHAQDRVCVASFSLKRLRGFHRLMGTEVALSEPPATVAWNAYVPFLPRWIHSPGAALQVPELMKVPGGRVKVLTRQLVDNAHAAGKDVHVWDCDTREDMIRMIDLGVDGIVTDRPDVLKEVLLDRGLWNGA